MLAFLLACAPDDKVPPPGPSAGTTPTTPTSAPLDGVLADCPTTSGTICPLAGAGYGGRNADADPLLAWLSFPTGVAPGEITVISDLNGVWALSDGLLASVPGTDQADSDITDPTWLSDGTLAAVDGSSIVTLDPTTGARAELIRDRGHRYAGLAEDPIDADRLWFVDVEDHAVRSVSRSTGARTTELDAADHGFCDADARGVGWRDPEDAGGLAFSPDGATAWLVDPSLHQLCALDLATGTATVLSGVAGQPGYVDGAPADARWSYPTDLDVDPATGVVYVADTNNHVIRAIDPTTGVVSTVVGTGLPTCDVRAEDLLNPRICHEQHHGGDGGPAIDATLYRPFGVRVDADGALVVADTYDQRVRVVTP